MPAQRTLTVKIDPQALTALINGNFRLCFGFAVNGKFNVAAQSTTITENNIITWTESYAIAATSQEFRAGGVVMRGQSTRQPIEFKQKYTLDSWAKATIRSDPSIPSGSFGFYNGVNAAGIVYINTGDAEPVPIFIDTVNPPKFLTIYSPISQVMVWFDRNVQTSMMIVQGKIANPHIVDLTGTDSMTTTYQDNGDWSDS